MEIGAKDKPEIEKVCTISQKNQKRFETEQKIRTVMFFERDCMLWQYEKTKTLDERKKQVLERIEKNQESWIKEKGPQYLENVDYLDELRGELIFLTKELYR